mgnify:CR=1 FL=1|jgi:hypothetical protein
MKYAIFLIVVVALIVAASVGADYLIKLMFKKRK